MLKLLQSLCFVLFAVALSGCGFQLRDSYQLPPAMQKVAVQGPLYREINDVLTRQLDLAGVSLVDHAQAELIIEVIEDRLDRRTLSLSESGQVAEYEMIYTVIYELKAANKESVRQQVEVYRDYQDDPNFALAKTREREVLVTEMRQEAARQVLRQTIAALSE